MYIYLYLRLLKVVGNLQNRNWNRNQLSLRQSLPQDSLLQVEVVPRSRLREEQGEEEVEEEMCRLLVKGWMCTSKR